MNFPPTLRSFLAFSLRIYDNCLFLLNYIFSFLFYLIHGFSFPPNPPIRSNYVLITGCSTGIGKDAALKLANSGFKVFACVRREQDFLDHPNIIPLILDVTNADHIQRCVQYVLRELRAVQGRQLVAVINNAGVACVGRIESTSHERLRQCFNVNVNGVLNVTREFTQLLKESGGRVIIIGSIAGQITVPHMGIYAMSKHALEAYADALRREWWGQGLSVSLIQPGAIITPIWDKGKNDEEDQEFKDTVVEKLKVVMLHVAPYPEAVSRSIMHALNSPFPMARYKVGWDAKMLGFISLLPEWIVDWMVDTADKLK